MKKIFRNCATLMLAIFMLVNSAVFYANEVRVEIDGSPVPFDVAPFIQEGRTMVPLRAIADMLDIEVEWNPDNREISYRNHEDVIFVLTVGYEYVAFGLSIDDMQTVHLDAPPVIVNDRTFVPLRFIAESLGVYIDFVDGVVHISTGLEGYLPLPQEVIPVTTDPAPVNYPQEAPAENVSNYLDLDRIVWRAGSASSNIYHSVDNCGNMNPQRAVSMTRGQAHQSGLRACLRCW